MDIKWDMGKLYVESAKEALKKASKAASESVSPEKDQNNTSKMETTTSEIPSTSDPTLQEPKTDSGASPKAQSKSKTKQTESNISGPNFQLRLATTDVLLNSMPKRTRSSSVLCTSPKVHPPLFCRHASIESFEVTPPLVNNNSLPVSNLPSILYLLASFLFSAGLVREATDVGKLSLSEYRKGKDTLGTAHILHLMGVMLSEQGHPVQARLFLTEALDFHSKLDGESLDVVILLDQLGWVLKSTGDRFDALKHFNRALSLHNKAFEDRKELGLSILNGLGSVLSDIGNLVQAREYFDRALSIGSELFGRHHATVARAVHNIGNFSLFPL